MFDHQGPILQSIFYCFFCQYSTKFACENIFIIPFLVKLLNVMKCDLWKRLIRIAGNVCIKHAQYRFVNKQVANVRLSLFHVFKTAPHSSFNIFLSRAKRKNTQTPHFPFYSLTQQMCFYGAQPFSSFLFSSLHFIKHGHRGFTTQHFLSLATLMLPIKFSVAQFIMLMYNSTLLVSAQLEDMFAPKF